MSFRRLSLSFLPVVIVLSACGQKGPLFLPRDDPYQGKIKSSAEAKANRQAENAAKRKAAAEAARKEEAEAEEKIRAVDEAEEVPQQDPDAP